MQWRPTVLVLAVLAILGLAAWGCFGITQHLIVAVDRWGDAAPSKPAVASILANVDTATKNVAAASGAISDSSRQEAKDIRLATLAIGRAADNIGAIEAPARRTLDALTGTANALTKTESAATDTLASTKPLIASLTSTVADSDSGVKALQSRISDPRIDRLMDSLDATTAHVDGTTGDIEKAVHRVTDPPPCKGRWCWAITTGKVIWAGREIPEMTYYLDQLLPH